MKSGDGVVVVGVGGGIGGGGVGGRGVDKNSGDDCGASSPPPPTPPSPLFLPQPVKSPAFCDFIHHSI